MCGRSAGLLKAEAFIQVRRSSVLVKNLKPHVESEPPRLVNGSQKHLRSDALVLILRMQYKFVNVNRLRSELDREVAAGRLAPLQDVVAVLLPSTIEVRVLLRVVPLTELALDHVVVCKVVDASAECLVVGCCRSPSQLHRPHGRR